MKFRALFPFGGLGAGARGFLDARVRLFGSDITFECLGGIDNDPRACEDFEYLTDSPAWCADITDVLPSDLVARYGPEAPDCVFLSPPCKGASGLLPKALSGTEKYQRMNELALVWIETMLAAWKTPPKLVLFENVPRLKTRAKKMIASVKRVLSSAGYALHEGFHDCGELGGLAQRRRRYLLVARLKSECESLLYKPPKKRVRACGEVLEKLPVPGTKDASAFGRIHQLPKITWLNWVRLALIPPGGDWRDLEGVLKEGQARREVFKRQEVCAWDEPTGVVTGAGANAIGHVADPRPWFRGVLGVKKWEEPSSTVTGRAGASTGSYSVADPRAELALPPSEGRHWNKYAVGAWDAPSRTVIGATQPGSGGPGVADPRVRYSFDAGYAVLSWDQAARTIAGTTAVGCGAYSVADPRPAPKITHELEEALREASLNPMKPPGFLPVIVSRDGSWHRPMTTLELAALQGLPTSWKGAPLHLSGKSSSAWRERIGNAVPVGAAMAIAEKMLITLAHSTLGSFGLDSGAIWVRSGIEADGLKLYEVTA